MLADIYHPHNPITIVYEQIAFRFQRAESLLASYFLLVRNKGDEAINVLNVLVPHSLYTRHGDNWHIGGVKDDQNRKRDPERFAISGDTASLRIPAPHELHIDMLLEGEWRPDDARFCVPDNLFSGAQLVLLQNLHRSFFQIQLSTPLMPGAARWFSFGLWLDDIAVQMPTSLGVVAHYTITSPDHNPADITDELRSISADAAQSGPPWLPALATGLLESLELSSDRNVLVNTLEIVVLPGNPAQRFVLSTSTEGDVVAHLRCPCLRDDYDECVDKEEAGKELVYEWKGGTSIAPTRDQSRQGRFAIRLVVLQAIQPMSPPLRPHTMPVTASVPSGNESVPTTQQRPDKHRGRRTTDPVSRMATRITRQTRRVVVVKGGSPGSPKDLADLKELARKARFIDRSTHYNYHYHVNGEEIMGDSIRIQGNVSGAAIGRGARIDARDINTYNSSVDGSENLDDTTKAVLKNARAAIEKLDLPKDEQGDAIDNLGKLTDELSKPDPNTGRIGRIWRSIKEIAPPIAAILSTAQVITKLLAGN